MGVDELQALVERARSLDPEAWELLYRRVHDQLFGYARRRVGNPEAAEDCVSETLTRAIARIERFTWAGAGFEAWLYGILRNVVREAWRAQARGSWEADLPIAVSNETPLDEVIAGEEAIAVRDAFARLTADEQEVLELRVVAGLSAQEVAAVQGRRAGAVRMAQHRAIGRLRSLLSEVRTDG